MTYQAGIGPSLARAVGISDACSEPTLTCDVVGCGYRIVVRPVRGCMPGWLANKKAPKFWKRWPQPDDKPAQHTCPECTRALATGGIDIALRKAKP